MTVSNNTVFSISSVSMNNCGLQVVIIYFHRFWEDYGTARLQEITYEESLLLFAQEVVRIKQPHQACTFPSITQQCKVKGNLPLVEEIAGLQARGACGRRPCLLAWVFWQFGKKSIPQCRPPMKLTADPRWHKSGAGWIFYAPLDFMFQRFFYISFYI